MISGRWTSADTKSAGKGGEGVFIVQQYLYLDIVEK